jgi:proliferating cell nuclear antigen PCNA|uniref:Proliferating cell nuclear antigen PCNA N-terminal domain-containing protein n=1 Tax=viral metagenome TaxID=1070528 RepID=A0A6C0CZE3_9ZZZZ
MTIIFNAKTGEAYHLKVLSELLSNNLKTGCFEINKDGFVLRMMDNNRKTLIDLNLSSENFSLYRFTAKNKLHIGLNLNHFHKMLKSIKKKDSIQLYIDENEINDLAIKAIPKENTRVTTSYIKIQNIQNIDIDIPTGYGKPVIVLSSEFQKMCKDMITIGSSIKVSFSEFQITFNCDSGGILKRTVEFGENDTSIDKQTDYTQEISTEQLTRITKIAGLSTNMQIFSAPNLPLLFRSNVGSLGKISIYIKSKEQIEKENFQGEVEYDSE